MNGNITNYFTNAPVLTGGLTATWSGTTTIATADADRNRLHGIRCDDCVWRDSADGPRWRPTRISGTGSISPLDVAQLTGSTFTGERTVPGQLHSGFSTSMPFDSLYADSANSLEQPHNLEQTCQWRILGDKRRPGSLHMGHDAPRLCRHRADCVSQSKQTSISVRLAATEARTRQSACLLARSIQSLSKTEERS